MEEERAQPAGLDLSLDELINASKSAGRKGGRGGGRGSGGRGGRGGGFRQQRGIDEGGAGPIRRHPGGQMRAQQPMQQIQYAMPRFQPPLPQYSRAPPPLPQGPPPGTQFGRGGGGFGSRDRPPQTSKQYKQHEVVRKDPNGDVALSLYEVDIVTVRKNGDVLLDAGKFRGQLTFQSMNDALNTFGMKLVAMPEGSDNWQVSDGLRFLKRFENGMVIPAGAAEGPGRGLALLAAHGDRSARATVASNAAAAQAGLLGSPGGGRGGGYAGRGGYGGRGGGGRGVRYSPY